MTQKQDPVNSEVLAVDIVIQNQQAVKGEVLTDSGGNLEISCGHSDTELRDCILECTGSRHSDTELRVCILGCTGSRHSDTELRDCILGCTSSRHSNTEPTDCKMRVTDGQ